MPRHKTLGEFAHVKDVVVFIGIALASGVVLVRIALVEENGSKVSHVVLDKLRGRAAQSKGDAIGVDGTKKISLASPLEAVGTNQSQKV